MRQSFKKQVTVLFLLTAILFGNLLAFAQKKAATKSVASDNAVANNQKKDTKKDCKGNYSGQVTYNRTIKQTSTGKFGSTYTRTYVYQSTIPIRDDGSTQGSIYPNVNGIGGSFNFYGKAEATMTETVNDLKISEKDDFCTLSLKGAQNKTRVKCISQWTRQANATGRGDVNVFLGFNGNKYKISLDNPKVDGTSTDTSNSSCTGTCGKDTPINHSRTDFIKGATQSGSYTDEQMFDPTSFNRLSGTFTRTSGNETVTISWNLARCAPPLMINDLTFETHRFPDAEKWHSIDPLQGTVDGNLVKLTAKVFNGSGETSYATVKFTDTKTGEMLPDASVSVQVKLGETRDVEYEWDTSGYAWDEERKPTLARMIKAEVEGDSMEKKIIMIPKPVVTVHGLWSNAAAWADYPGFLRESHSLAWQGFAVGADPEHGKMETGNEPGNYRPTNTIYQNARELEKQIEFTRKSMNAWHVDIVAHSMGGLISRQYINTFMPTEFDMRPAVTHLVMLGTPNQGSPCADVVNYLFEENGHQNMEAMRELKPIIVRAFNARITDRKKVLFSIMAGTPLPFTCQEKIRGDLVVPIQSALYTIPDRAFTKSDHLSMTGREDFQSFVLPRLAVGPKKAQAERYQTENFAAENREVYQNKSDNEFKNIFQNASFQKTENETVNNETEEVDSLRNLTAKHKVELAANQTKEVEIPVNEGKFAGIVLVGTPAISATLFDANGAIVGKNVGGMTAVKQMFRTIGVEKAISKSVWKLKLENIGNQPTVAFVAGFASNDPNSDFTVEAIKSNADGSTLLKGKWAIDNSNVTTAKITAKINGQLEAIEFFDDGTHGDEAANDGVFGALTGKLAAGEYFVEAKATAGVQTVIAFTEFKVGATANVSKPAVKSTKSTPVKRKN